MKTKIFLLLLLCSFEDNQSTAQIVKNTNDKAREKMAAQSNQKVNKATDKGLDKKVVEAKDLKVKDDSTGKKEDQHSDMKEPDNQKTKSD